MRLQPKNCHKEGHTMPVIRDFISLYSNQLTLVFIAVNAILVAWIVKALLDTKTARTFPKKSKNIVRRLFSGFNFRLTVAKNFIKARKQFKSTHTQNQNLLVELTKKTKRIDELLQQLNSSSEAQSQLSNQIVDLHILVESLKAENKGVNQLWNQTAEENSKLVERNKQLLQYTTSLAKSFRKVVSTHNQLNTTPNYTTAVESLEHQPLSVDIHESLSEGQTADEFINNQIRVGLGI